MLELKEAWKYFLIGKSWASNKENIFVKKIAREIVLYKNNTPIAWLNHDSGKLKVIIKD